MAVEAAPAEVLCFFRGGIVRVLDGETNVRGEVGHGHGMAGRGRRGAEKGHLRKDDDGGSVFEIYGGIAIVIEFIERRVG